jgi:signal transduction histidine kinase
VLRNQKVHPAVTSRTVVRASGSRRGSVSRRIFLSFLLVLTSFVGVASFSIVQHAKTASTLRLLHDGYLPLSLSVSEARATQGAFATMVERTLEGGETSAAEGWLEVARRVRPFALRRALDAATLAEHLTRRRAEQKPLSALRAELEAVLVAYELAEDDFDSLAAAVASRDRASRAAALASLRQREREAEIHIAQAWTLISERIASTSKRARDAEQRAFGLLLGLGIVSLVVGVAITLWAQRALIPLTRLSARVAAVASGDLAARPLTPSDDEIGRVASEFERMVAALRERDDKLRKTERLAAAGRMAAHVTHEVRNPLNSIRLNAELLEEDLAGGQDEPRKLLRSIVREVDRLTDLTEQYLRLVRLPDPKQEPVDLHALIGSVLAFVAPELQRARVQTVSELKATRPFTGDEGQLRQALLNLCRNAREAMPQGGTLRVRTSDANGGLLVEVEDEGQGIAPSEREKIFDLFYTTKEHGTGLGLPLTRQIAEAHGGSIACGAGDNGGTRFALWLPGATAGTTPPGHAIETR